MSNDTRLTAAEIAARNVVAAKGTKDYAAAAAECAKTQEALTGCNFAAAVAAKYGVKVQG